MNNSITEHYDKVRFNVIKWYTVGFGLWFGFFILKDFIHSHWITGALLLVGFVGMILLVSSQLRLLKFVRRIKRDQQLKQALNNEYHNFLREKSFRIGFWGFGVVSVLMVIANAFFSIPALLVSEIILYVGVMSSLLSFLILTRN